MAASTNRDKVVSIIIVTFNSSSCIRECLNPFVQEENFEIIVVDNASEDECVKLVKNEFPFARVIPLYRNIGFGSACNIGIAASSANVVMLLNPDTVASPSACRALAKFLLGDPSIGIVGGRLIDHQGRPLQSMGDMPSIFGLLLDKPLTCLAKRLKTEGHIHRWLTVFSSKFRVPREPERTVWVSAAALCCRRSSWQAVGGFDENFFMYYEDVDLCLRIAKAGWEIWHLPNVVIRHLSGASFAGDLYRQKKVYYENQRYFFQKHLGKISLFSLNIMQRLYFALGLYRVLAGDRIGRQS